LSKFSEEGFLSTDTDDLVEQCNKTYKEWVELCESINKYCLNIINKLQVHPNERQECLVSALFLRMLAIFEGSYILNKRGMDSETKILLRTLLETLFSLCAIAKHQEIAEEFFREHYYLKYKALKKMMESSSKEIIPDSKDDSLRLIELKNEVSKQKSKPLSVQELSKKAELGDFYTSVYPLFSWTVHSNIMEIGKLLDGESDDTIDGVFLSPGIAEADRYFLVGVECIVIALRSINTLFNLKENDKIEEYAKSYGELYKKNKKL